MEEGIWFVDVLTEAVCFLKYSLHAVHNRYSMMFWVIQSILSILRVIDYIITNFSYVITISFFFSDERFQFLHHLLVSYEE